MNRNHVGTQIREIRVKQKMSMKQVADIIGCDYQHVQRIELTGKASLKSIQDIASALGHAIFIFPQNIVK